MTRFALVASLVLASCAVAETCPPDSGTWFVDFRATPVCGVDSNTAFVTLKESCARVSVLKGECAQEVDFLCPNGVRMVMRTDPADGYGYVMIETADGCVGFADGEIR